MLAKKFKLPIQNWLAKKNKKIFTLKSNAFVVKASSNNLDFSRFGVVISSKVSKSAVKRNAIKRAIFNFIRLKKMQEIPDRDILIIVYSLAGQLKKEEFQKELEKTFINFGKNF